MLINGYAIRELVDRPDSHTIIMIGMLVTGVSGASWVALWTDPDKKVLTHDSGEYLRDDAAYRSPTSRSS